MKLKNLKNKRIKYKKIVLFLFNLKEGNNLKIKKRLDELTKEVRELEG